MSHEELPDDAFAPNRHSARSISIAAQNDLFRQTMNPDMGMVVMTQTVNALPEATKRFLIQSVRNYQDFKQDGNDPYCEHDFGVIDIDGGSYYFKIDYYDPSFSNGSEDPANPAVTRRVLQIMAREDY